MLLLLQVAVVFAIITANQNDDGGVYAFLSTTPSCVKIRSASTNILRGFDDVWWAISSGIGDDDSSSSNNDDIDSSNIIKSSHIVSIKSSNIAGLINEDIKVDFGQEAGTSLIAITGESGTGKSLLVSKAIDLVTGGKAISSLVPSRTGESNDDEENTSFVELTANLYEPQLSTVLDSLQQYGIDPSILYNNNNNNNNNCEQSNKLGHLHLKRTLTTTENGRLKSVCEINGQQIPLKTMRHISAPLLVRVDVAIASGALARPTSRLSILDMGVEDSFKQNCIKCRDEYKEAKNNRERIKHELESRVLPSSLQGMSNSKTGFDEEQMELMQHWLEELDSFETRINSFQQAVSTQYNEMLAEGESNDKSSGIGKALHNLQSATWRGDTESNDDDHSLIAFLLDFREGMKTVESQLVSTHEAYESLASLTAPNSALVSVENTRKLLFSISNEDSGPLFETIEKTHELLNTVEESLNNCARSIDGSSNSLMSTLEKMQFPISIEEVDGIIADWNALSRKHGISPYSLPNCHQTIREELDGNVEALKLLPEAEERERITLEQYSYSCRELSDARKKVATQLSSSVSSVLPSLGLEGSTLKIDLGLRSGGFDKPYYGTETLGVDIADFLLLHEKNTNEDSKSRGGSLDQVGSSGEKSRILLAIETALPGSIGSTCNSFLNSAESITSQSDFRTPPISIVYDEIDAHVGGRAAVTMAKLLAEQSRFRRRRRSRDDESLSNTGSQIIAITHSASLAAIADRHIVVERGNNGSKGIRTYTLDETNRRQEIARMASGDLASGEAKTFADALIRDAQKELNL